MAKMKRWTGTAWEVLDAKDADTVDGKHASDFMNAISGDYQGDPNTTQTPLIVTNHANSPKGGVYWYIQTVFYLSKTGNRMQLAFSYYNGNEMYFRVYKDSTWSAWVPYAPANHASQGTEYGIATAGNYGHARVWDGLDESNRLPGVALSAYQGKVLNDKIEGKAPINHRSPNNTYGLGTPAYYGHVAIRNDLTATAYQDGQALSAYQGKVLKDLIDSSKIEAIESTSSGSWNLGLAKWAIVTTNLPSIMVNGATVINTNDSSNKFVMIQDIGGRVYATGFARHQGSASATSLNSVDESRYSSSNYIRISSSDSVIRKIRIIYGY